MKEEKLKQRKDGRRTQQNRGEHSRGEREKKRPEKYGEKKERFQLKRLQNAPYIFCVFLFFNVMTSLALIVLSLTFILHLLKIFIVNK